MAVNVNPKVVNFHNNRTSVKITAVADVGVTELSLTVPTWVEAYGDNITGSTLTITDRIGIFYVRPKEGFVDKQYGSGLLLEDDTTSVTVVCLFTPDAGMIDIKDVVNDLQIASFEDSYYNDAPKHVMMQHAKRWVQEANISSFGTPRFMEFVLGDDNSITKPFDMIKLIRAYWVDGNGKLNIIYKNKSANYSSNYKLDSDGALILDQAGYPILTTGQTPKPNSNSDNAWYEGVSGVGEYFVAGGQKSRGGEYAIDEQGDRLVFADTPSKNIVLEYLSNPLLDFGDKQKITIPLVFRQALENYIYWRIVCRRANVPKNELFNAEREYYNEYRKARNRYADVTEVVQAMKSIRNPVKW
jgi:hypothetical protein